MPWAAVELASDSSGEDPGLATLGLQGGRGLEAPLSLLIQGSAGPAMQSPLPPPLFSSHSGPYGYFFETKMRCTGRAGRMYIRPDISFVGRRQDYEA